MPIPARVLVLLAMVGWLLVPAPLAAQATADAVSITRISPPNLSLLPTPQRLVVSLDLTYTLTSAPRGRMRIVGRRSDGPGVLAEHTQAIPGGSGHTLRLALPEVALTSPTRAATLLVSVTLEDERGTPLAGVQSTNRLAGRLEVHPSALPPVGSRTEVVSLWPPLGGQVYVARTVPMEMSMYWSVQGKPRGYLSVDLGDAAGKSTWQSVLVSLPSGTGMARLQFPIQPLPARLVGSYMRVTVSLRLDPLGGAVDARALSSYRLAPWTTATGR